MRQRAWRYGAASAFASVASAWGWTRLIAAPELWWTSALAVLAVVGTGALLRLIRQLPSALIFVVQFAVAGLWLLIGPFEPASTVPIAEQLRLAQRHIAGSAAPLPWSLDVVLLFVALTLFFTLIDELLIHVARAPHWTIAPLAGWFIVYALIPRPQASPWSLAATLTGYLAILLASTLTGVARWRRGRVRGAARRPAYGAAAGAGLAAAALATAIGLTVGNALPSQDRPGLHAVSASLSVEDPRIDLRNNLHAQASQVMLTYQTNGTTSTHLRLAALTQLDLNGWSMPTLRTTPLPPAGAALPAPTGMTLPATGVRHTTISTAIAPTEFFPTPYAAQRVTGAGADWAYDAATLTLYRGSGQKPNDAPAVVSYAVDSIDVEPTLDQLRDDPVGQIADGSDRVPAGTPPSLVDLTNAITAKATTAQEKASAIQDYLRSDRFRYDLTVPPPDVAGLQGISQFVTVTHAGYCEHFAAAMAVMARIAGIPSRVVIGFTPGRQLADGRWEVTNRDMHAWPELYFSGWGWLRFEPTPSSISGDAPAYSVGTRAADPRPEDTTTAQPTSTSVPASADAPTIAVHTNAPAQGAAGAGRGAGLPAWAAGLLRALGVLALLAALVVLPAALRRRRRSARLDDDAPPRERVLAAWAELRDTTIDLGRAWPPESPRALARALVARLDPDGAARLAELVPLVERARYGAAVDSAPPLAADVTELRRQLIRHEDQGARVRAAWLPRSVWTELRPRRLWERRPRYTGQRSRRQPASQNIHS